MGKRGPPPTPTSIRLLRGNPSGRALNKDEPIPPEGVAKPPDWLTGRSKELWTRIAPILTRMKVLTSADPDALALLCDAYAEYLGARDVVRGEGATYESRQFQMDEAGNTVEKVMIRPRPEVAMAQDAWKRVRQMMQEFGLTPSSRSRIEVPGATEEADPFVAWRQRGSSG
jgi:P27 family predicted phage terminase small subunit